MKDRFLFCRLGGIGDVLHTLPLVRYVKEKYPDASVEYITSENIKELLENYCKFIDRIWVFKKKNKGELTKQILEVSHEITCFFNLHSSLSFFFFNLFYLRAKKYFPYKKKLKEHAVVNFAKTFDSAITKERLKSDNLFVEHNKEMLDKFDLKEKKYICFVTGVGGERKHRAWPFEKWIDLTEKFLNSTEGLKVVFLGGEDVKKTFDDYACNGEFNLKEKLPGFNERAINLTGKLNLSDSAKIISRALYLVSCDTGLLHLASALSVKVVGLYGPTLVDRTGPFTQADCSVLIAQNCECTSNNLKKCKEINSLISSYGYCMNNLSVDKVLNTLLGDKSCVSPR